MLDVSGTEMPAAKPEPILASTTDKPASSTNDLMAGVFVAVVLAITLTVFFLGRAEQTTATQREVEYQALLAETQTGDLGKVAAEVKRVAEVSQILVNRGKQITIWSGLFKDFQQTVSPGIQIQSLTVDERNNLKIDGNAPGYQEVANYLATLRASTFLSSIELISSSLVPSPEGGNRINFSFGMTVKPGATTAQGGASDNS